MNSQDKYFENEFLREHYSDQEDFNTIVCDFPNLHSSQLLIDVDAEEMAELDACRLAQFGDDYEPVKIKQWNADNSRPMLPSFLLDD